MKYSKETHPLLDTDEIKYWNAITDVKLNGGELDTLVALVEQGPVWDGDVPSKSGRNSLIQMVVDNCRLASRVIVKGEQGYTAATYIGSDLYKAQFVDDPHTCTVTEAKAARLTRRVIACAKG